MLTLAGELLPDPDFIFLDEPTNAIDPMSRRACWELLSERARAGKTIILSTQFAWEADQCTHIAFMSGGTIRRIGTPAEMRDRISEIDPGVGTACARSGTREGHWTEHDLVDRRAVLALLNPDHMGPIGSKINR